ncbi:MAG: outer membrane protein assembly factor BamD [Alphaproteobacteria bacterium]|nr:outer membrane protein assembly factor BamD [Alphaproteobacteria bacterium]
MKTARLKIAVAAVVLAAALSACGGDKIEYADADVGTLYNKAHEFMAAGQYRFAAVMFDEVERQHPYSIWARRATLMSAYNHYLSNDYDAAILAAQRFLSLHPGNKDAPYAYYLIAICYYEQISDVGRDQKATQQALDALNEVVRRFGNTDYAEDARLKIELTRDHLAGKEMTIGRFYESQKEYIAAMGRFRNVIKNYQTTSQVPEALHRLVECYLALGLQLEAQKAAAVLGYNFPKSKWFRYSYAMLEGKGLEPVKLPEDKGSDGEPKNFFDWLF